MTDDVLDVFKVLRQVFVYGVVCEKFMQIAGDVHELHVGQLSFVWSGVNVTISTFDGGPASVAT